MNKIITLSLLFCFTASHAQYKKPFFQTLSVVNGLPEQNVGAVLQDRLGYMWLGTQNGLVRYDGYQLKQYTMLNDEGVPVSMSAVNNLYEDRSGKLWALFFQEGLYYLDRTKDVFIKVPLNKQIEEKIKTADFFRKWIEDKEHQHLHWFFTHYDIEDVHHIYLFDDTKNSTEDYSALSKGKYYIPMIHGGADLAADANGKIWIAADSLLSYFDWTTRSFVPWFVIPDSSRKFMFSIITPDLADADILWLNTWMPKKEDSSFTRKFFRFNTKTKGYKQFSPADIDPGLIPADSYKRIFTDSLKRTWITTNKSIALYNPSSGNFTDFPYPAALLKADIFIQTIASDKDGNLWIGGGFKGLVYLDVKKALFTLVPITEEEGSLPDNNNINKIFFDKTGTLWVNMTFAGIAFSNRLHSLLNPTPLTPPFIDKEKKINANQFLLKGIAGDSSFFVADTAGLFEWNHYHQNSFTKIDLNDKKLIENINIIKRGPGGSIWIGSFSEGLINYNPATRSLKKYQYDATDSSSISSNLIAAIATDQEGNTWIGTYNKGLCSFNYKTNKFTRYPFIKNDFTKHGNGKLDDATVLSLCVGDPGMIWAGTNFGGLNRVETATGKITSFLDYKMGFTCITDIYQDSHKKLWAATYSAGLFEVNKETGALTKYTTKDGLLYNSIISIKEDAKGNIWCATTRGLSMFDPQKKLFKNYEMEILINWNSFYKESNGMFHVTTKKGLVSFDPAQINEVALPLNVLVESVSYHTANDKDTTLFANGNSEIELKYNENRINFSYVALSFENAESTQYAYKLDGYDNNWIQAGTQRIATYTNLSPGTYTFHVKAANSDAVWSEAATTFTITILPPWWKTWWAYCTYILLVGGSIWAFVQYRSRALRKENILLEEKVNHRTEQLQQSLHDLRSTQSQLIQSEKMASLGELTAGIAHEIQNPLNFVNNFSEVSVELIKEMVDEVDKGNTSEVKAIADDLVQNLEKINHHGKRADAIVKGMLQHSRSSSGQKEMTDINALCDEYLRLAYHGLRAKDKSFNATLKTDFDETIGKINIIPQDIGRVVLNLITNAFYAVAEKKKNGSPGYEPTVSVSTMRSLSGREGRGEAIIKVADNGNGIPKNILDKIFQPFFTTKPTGQGTGLGLSLSYDIVKAHSGELKVETKEGEGSEFILLLPIV